MIYLYSRWYAVEILWRPATTKNGAVTEKPNE
jgi:hypothetical protein